MARFQSWHCRVGVVASLTLGLVGCQKQAPPPGRKASSSKPVMLAPTPDYNNSAMRVPPAPRPRPAGKNVVTPAADAGINTPQKVDCDLPYGLVPSDTKTTIKHKLSALGMALKSGEWFHPAKFLGFTFKDGNYDFEYRGPRKGKLRSLSLSSPWLRRRSNADWYFNRFVQGAKKHWKQKVWIASVLTGGHPYTTKERQAEWRCGPRQRWQVKLIQNSDTRQLTQVTATWSRRPPPPKRTTAAQASCKPIPGLTAAKLKKLLAGKAGTRWHPDRGGRDDPHTMSVEPKGEFEIWTSADNVQYAGSWSLKGTEILLDFATNVYDEDRSMKRRYRLMRCNKSLCLVRQDRPGHPVFACGGDSIPP